MASPSPEAVEGDSRGLYALRVWLLSGTAKTQMDAPAFTPPPADFLTEMVDLGQSLTAGCGPVETMNIDLPEAMKQCVQGRVTQGGHSSVSEFVRDLVIADQKRNAEERIDALLLEGLDSGDAAVVTPGSWDEKKRELTERFARTDRPQ